MALLSQRALDAWVFAGGEWLLRDANGPNVARERFTVGFDPTVAEHFANAIGVIDKIVGVSDDVERLARVEAACQVAIGAKAATMRSQSAYLDVTSPKVNKGDAVATLCRPIGVDLARTAVIGDMFNDVAMFERGGLSIAMGQAPESAKSKADAITLSTGKAASPARWIA